MIMLAVAAALVALALFMRHWSARNANDLGTMSEQWVAEYNAQHP